MKWTYSYEVNDGVTSISEDLLTHKLQYIIKRSMSFVNMLQDFPSRLILLRARALIMEVYALLKYYGRGFSMSCMCVGVCISLVFNISAH